MSSLRDLSGDIDEPGPEAATEKHARIIYIVLSGRDTTGSGAPGQLAVYRIGHPRRVGRHFDVPVLALREDNLQVLRPSPDRPAGSAQAAQALLVRSYQQLARKLELKITVTSSEAEAPQA